MTFGVDGSIAERLQSLAGKFHKKTKNAGKDDVSSCRYCKQGSCDNFLTILTPLSPGIRSKFSLAHRAGHVTLPAFWGEQQAVVTLVAAACIFSGRHMWR